MRAADQPLVSIVVPVYNRADVLGRTLDSIAGSAYRPLQLVIVDDGSIDASAAVANAWCDELRDNGIETLVLQQDNAGAPAARNHGLAQCSGAFVYFLDSDDTVSPQMLERAVGELIDSGAEILLAGYEEIDADGQMLATHRGYNDSHQLEHVVFGRVHPVTLRVLYRRELTQRIGPWDESLGPADDTDYIQRALVIAHSSTGVAEALVQLHRGRGDHLSDRFQVSFKVHCAVQFLELLDNRRSDMPHLVREQFRKVAQLACKLQVAGDTDQARRCLQVLDDVQTPLTYGLRIRRWLGRGSMRAHAYLLAYRYRQDHSTGGSH